MPAKKQYYIISLTGTKGDFILWWCPDCRGYTRYLSGAGLYDEDDVERRKSYLNNGHETLAVLSTDVERFIRRVVHTDDIREMCKQPLYQTSDGMQTQAFYDKENERLKKEAEERKRKIKAGMLCEECECNPKEGHHEWCSHYGEEEDD